MDTVRFGRVLGFGARSAAKTLIQAVDAAKAQNPASTGSEAAKVRRTTHISSARTGAGSSLPGSSNVQRNSNRTPQQVGGVRAGARQFHQLAVKPAARLTGALLLEVAGVFFAIFALYGVNTMWRAGLGWHMAELHSKRFMSGVVMLVVFGYFRITSFVRARRRER